MLIPHKGHTDTIQVYSVTVMTHVKALQAGHSSQGTSEPITPAPQRKVVSKLTGRNAGQSLVPPAGGTTGSAVGPINGRSREEDTVQALMDSISLPRFARFEDGGLPKTRLWPITEHPPSSPASVRGGNRSRTPSPCYQLDDVSSASSIGETTTNDCNLELPTESAHSITPVGSIVISSDDDVPLCFGQEDRRKVQRMWLKTGYRARTRSLNTYRYQGRSRLISLFIPRRHETGRSRFR